MSILKSSDDHLTINADGSGKAIKFQADGVQKASISSAGLLTSTTIDATALTGNLPAIDGSSLTGLTAPIGKNLIINGAMQVSQRGTSFAAIGNGVYSLDRWQFFNSSIGAYTVTQDSSGPAGFANSLKIDCTTADASPASGDYLELMYRLEGQDLQHLKKGTASAESVTLSFWVKCNKTGDMQVNVKDVDNDRQIGNTVTINSADTWEQKSLTFAGDTTGALGDDSSNSIFIEWWLDSGSSLSSGAVPTSWEARVDTDRNAGGTLALADSTSNYINITGVKLEVGTAATDYDHRSYGEELSLCERYYHRHTANIAGAGICAGVVYNTTSAAAAYRYPTIMRTNPTLSYSDVGDFRVLYTTTKVVTAISGIETISGVRLWFNSSGMTAGNGMIIDANNTSCWIAFDAEL